MQTNNLREFSPNFPDHHISKPFNTKRRLSRTKLLRSAEKNSIPFYLLEDLPNHDKNRLKKRQKSRQDNLETEVYLNQKIKQLLAGDITKKGELSPKERKFQYKQQKYRELFAEKGVVFKKDSVLYDSPIFKVSQTTLPKLKNLSDIPSVGKLKGDPIQPFEDIKHIDYYFYKKSKELEDEVPRKSPNKERKKSLMSIFGKSKTPTHVLKT